MCFLNNSLTQGASLRPSRSVPSGLEDTLLVPVASQIGHCIPKLPIKAGLSNPKFMISASPLEDHLLAS